MNRSLEYRTEAPPPEPQTVEKELKSPDVSLLERLEQAEASVTETENTIDAILDELPNLPAEKQAEQQQKVLALSNRLKNFKIQLKTLENQHDLSYKYTLGDLAETDVNIEKARAKGDKDKESALLKERDEHAAIMRGLVGLKSSKESTLTQVEQKIADYKRKEPDAANVETINPDARKTRLGDTENPDTQETELVQSSDDVLMDEMVKLGMERDNAGDNKALADIAENKRLALKKQLAERWAQEEAEEELKQPKKAA